MHVSCTLKKTDPQVQIKAMCRFHPSPSSNQSRAGAITSHPPPNWVVSVKNDSAASSDTRTCVSACDSAAFPSCQVDTTFKSLTSRSWTVHAMWDRHTRHGHNPHVHWTQTCILRQTHSYCTTESAYTVRSGSVSTWTVLTPKTLLSYLWVTLTCFERSEMWCKFANREKKKSPICYSSINIWFYLNPDVSEYICFLWILIFKSLKYLKTICMLFLELWWWHVQTGTSFS